MIIENGAQGDEKLTGGAGQQLVSFEQLNLPVNHSVERFHAEMAC
jgi:hypothetical protein